jgi:elongation factor P
MKNLRTGATIDRTWNAGEKIEQARLDRKVMQFLYSEGADFHLMDMESFEQVTVDRKLIGDKEKYLKENTDVQVIIFKEEIVQVTAPDFMELVITETDPGFRGDTASGGSKPATLETGAVIRVPFFVNQGDKVRVDTRTDTYLERVK